MGGSGWRTWRRAGRALAVGFVLIVWLSAGTLVAAAARGGRPRYARSFRVTAVSGTVYRDLSRSRRVRLRGTSTVTNGATLDLSRGTARVQSTLPHGGRRASGTFTGTKVTLHQSGGSDGITKVTLTGEDFTSCHLATISRYKRKHRYHLQARVTADVEVGGASGSAQPTGGVASWTTTDSCDATTISDRQGQLTTRFGNAPTLERLLPGERSSGFCDRSPRAARNHRFCATASSYVGPPARLGFTIALPSSAGQYRLCVAPPEAAGQCHAYPLTRRGGVSVGEVLCSAGPAGPYIASWRVARTDLVPGVTVRSRGAPGGALSCQFVPLGGYLRTFGVEPLSGTPTVQTPGGSVERLATSKIVPFGTVVDTTSGAVAVITQLPDGSLQAGTFAGGAFGVTQSVQDGGITTIASEPESYAACPQQPPATVLRTLDVSADQAFRIQSRFVTESPVDGQATWAVTDQCGATMITGHTGEVSVADPYQSFAVTATGTAETQCDAATSPGVCTALAADPATATAAFYVSAITADSSYDLCSDQQGYPDGVSCGTYAFAGTGSLRKGEVACTGVQADGAGHGVVWGNGVNVIGSLPSLVNPLFPSAACSDEAGGLNVPSAAR